MIKIYLDDIRTPKEAKWKVARNYDDFVNLVNKIGIENIDVISLDHDLGDTAIGEYYNNAINKNEIDYSKIHEKTGYDCAKWIVDHYSRKLTTNKKFPDILVHSANPIGSKNITRYINNFRKSVGLKENCYRVQIPHE
jgi:hypothetical protein